MIGILILPMPGDRTGPFRWARKLYDPAKPDASQPQAIAASGDKEDAALLSGSTLDAGVIESKLWSGTSKKPGQRNWSGNAFVGDPGRDYFVSLDGFAILEAKPDAAGQYNPWFIKT